MSEPAAAETPRLEPVGARGVPWVVAFVGLVVCTNVANSVFASWVTGHPLGLLALSSRNRYMAFTAIDSGIAWWQWAGVGVVRLGVAAIVCHMLGRLYGDAALKWFWKFMGMSEGGVRQFERQFDSAEVALVPLFVGSNLVFVLTGAARSSWRKLVPLFLIGAAARFALIWWLAHAFESQLRRVVDFLTRYQWPIIGISVAVVVLANVRNFRRGR